MATKLFNHSNISEDLVKRFSKLKSAPKPIVTKKKASTNLATSPTGKKAALEQLLLSVPLDDDIAHFSDNKRVDLGLPLYSDNYEPSFCLPSSGYRSDSEGSKYRIRTSQSASHSPERSPDPVRKGNVRRVRSLNASTVTDRICEIREKIAKVAKERNAEKSSDDTNTFKRTGSLRAKRLNTLEKDTGVKRSRSFNINDRNRPEKNTLVHRTKLTSSSVTSIKQSEIDKLRQYFNNSSRKQQQATDNTDSTTKPINSSNSLRSSSFNTLQEAWEHRKPAKQEEDNLDAPVKPKRTSLSDAETDVVYRRKERRRLKRAGSSLGAAASDRSDSETETEESLLTQAALQRFERRSRLELRRNNSSTRRRLRADSDSNDENNNETSSEKTLDSGVFDIALSHLSEDISKLTKKYDSDDFILDDCVSPRSGYSSASESLASTTTFYDSAEETLDMDSRKKRPLKQDRTNMKTAVLNASRLNKMSAFTNGDTKKLVDKTSSLNPNPLNHHDHIKTTNCVREPTDKTNIKKNQQNTTQRTSKASEKNSVVTDKTSKEKQSVKTEESQKLRRHSKCCLPSNHPLIERKVSNSPNKVERKTSNSPNKSQLTSTQLKESLPQRKESVHHKACSGAENMNQLDCTSPNSAITTTATTTRRKTSIVGPAKRKEGITPKLARTCISPPLYKTPIEDSKIVKKKLNLESPLKGDQEKSILNKSQTLTEKSINYQDDEINNNNEKFSAHTSTSVESTNMDKHTPLSKFIVNKARSSVDETNSPNRILTRGDSIEVQISLTENKTPTNTTTAKLDTNLTRKLSLKHSSPSVKPIQELSIRESLDKGVQCLLLTGETTLSGKVINVSDTSKQVTINEKVIEELGSDILKDIQFTYPEYLIDPNSGSDTTDFARTTDIEDPVKLRMENARLQQLLFEVEHARAGTVKALLHVNTLLNKVQGDNTRLEGDIKVCMLEKEVLADTLKAVQAKDGSTAIEGSDVGLPGDNVVHKARKDTVDKSLSIIVESWKKEKKELVAQLNKSKSKEEDAEKAASRLRVQYKKVKEQLEHSNTAFTMTLKNNLDATKRMENELRNSLEDKQQLLVKCNEGNKFKRDLEALQQEMEELKASYDELEDEKELLEKKCSHLEKQKKQLQFEEEELHEQVAHSQEIIEKLTDVEEELKKRLGLEIKDKEYMQECLEETGQILYQLKNNEACLIKDKDLLLDDLEAELEEKETLQTTLSVTMDEHKTLVDRLQDMTNIHITVKESLQQANKKEKNYQEQIEVLTKTNHILHYTLEKEKEERMDTQEMYSIEEAEHKMFKSETLLKVRDLETKVEELLYENHKLNEMKEQLEKKCQDLQVHLEQEEEDNCSLRQQLSRVEQLKDTIEKELEILRDNGDEMEKSVSGLTKQRQEIEVDLKTEQARVEKLTCTVEETEETLEKVTKELNETKRKLDEYKCDYEDMQTKLRERQKRIRELESSSQEAVELRDKYQNRMNYYESETKNLRKKVNEQIEEIGTLQIESQRFSRERDTYKRNCEMSVRDFEAHKIKCTETLKKLKEEIIELSNKIVEKDRMAMKQKEQYQDQIDSTASDLQFLRNMLDTDIKKSVQRVKSDTSDIANDSDKLNVNFLRNTHDKFRDEFQSHVEKLEGMLKESKESSDSVTVVQSPMSKIKLEELKQLRNEVFELHSDLASVKSKFSNLRVELTNLKLGKPTFNGVSKSSEEVTTEELDNELSNLNELITKLECRHRAVMSRNAILLQRTLTENDKTAKDLVKKFQVISLEGENKQLKTLLGILKKKYDFNETEIAAELQEINETNKDDLPPLVNGNSNYISDSSEQTVLPGKHLTSRSDSNLRFSGSNRSSRRTKNYSFFDEMMSEEVAPPRRFNRDNLRSSGVSSYSSEDDDDYSPPRGLPRRYNTLPHRSRRPRQ